MLPHQDAATGALLSCSSKKLTEKAGAIAANPLPASSKGSWTSSTCGDTCMPHEADL